jgi:homeobox domain-containing protein
VKGQWPQNLAEDVKRRFDQWYSSHQPKIAASLDSHHSSLSLATITPHQMGGSGGGNGSSGGASGGLSVTSPHQHAHLVNGSSGLSSALVSTRHHHLLDKPAFDDDTHTNHPVFHGLSTQKTRMRTSFDPEMELPRLQQWFAENPHPSRHQVGESFAS